MAIDKQVYLYIIMALGTWFLFSVFAVTLARKTVFLKIQSIVAKKRGKVLIDYNDNKKFNFHTFATIHEDTINIKMPDSSRRLLGIDPRHVVWDGTFDIRKLSVNDKGSYLVEGYEEDQQGNKELKYNQAFLSPTLADKLFKKTLMSPENRDTLEQLLKYCVIGVGVILIISVVDVYLDYNSWKEVTNIAQTLGSLTQSITDKVVEAVQNVL
jgi:hypothetical protein